MSEQNYDYDEEKKLKDFSRETVEIANECATSRYNFAKALLKMNGNLADAYKNKEIKETLATEKAYMKLIIDNPEIRKDYEDMLKEEQNYKGLEHVLKAREHYISFHQSTMKNRAIMQGK